MSKKKYNFIDLFCGAGGFAKGFEMTNKFKCIGGIDNKPSAIETHKLNFKSSISICDDIRKVSPAQFSSLLNGQEVDLIIGGPPCPTFSTIGNAKIQSVYKNDKD
jgi:DNA (cytosine-5)-methyltransferase 1